MKVYCILFDTMPLLDEVVSLAKENAMVLLRQVGGCFTTSSCVEMLTGKMPSDLEKNGIGHERHVKYRDPVTNKIHWPWEKELIVNRLLDNGWRIRLQNPGYFSGYLSNNPAFEAFERTKTTLFPRSLKAEERFCQDKKTVDEIMLGNGPQTEQFYLDKIRHIHQIQSEKQTENTFYFVKYDQFHAAALKRCDKQVAVSRWIELMKQWDFNEPDAMFWFFSDHGDWHTMSEHLEPDNYLTWVMFKDNTENPIKVRSRFISISDFFPTIMDKFGYPYEAIPDVRSIQQEQDRDRIYYVEDARVRFDKQNSTTAIACRFTDWQGDKPSKLHQVSYFKPTDEYKSLVSDIDENGFIANCAEVGDIDPVMKQAVIDRFEWVDGELALVKDSVRQQLCSPQQHHHLQSFGKQCSIIFAAGKDLSDFKLYVRVLLAHGLPDGYELVIINDAGLQINGQWLKSMPSSVKIVKPVATATFEQKCRQAAIEAEGKYLLLLNGLVRFDMEMIEKSVRDCRTNRIKLSISPDNRCILVERSLFLHLETPGADMRQALVQSCSEKVFS